MGSAYLGNKRQLTAKTSKSKKATRHGLLELSRKDSAPRGSLTNLELLRFPPRKRKVNFGKPEEWILKKNKPGNGCQKTFSRFDFPEKNKRKKQTLIYFH